MCCFTLALNMLQLSKGCEFKVPHCQSDSNQYYVFVVSTDMLPVMSVSVEKAALFGGF